MRSFIAISLPDKTKQYLENITTPLKNLDLNAKWVNPDNLHTYGKRNPLSGRK